MGIKFYGAFENWVLHSLHKIAPTKQKHIRADEYLLPQSEYLSGYNEINDQVPKKHSIE